MKKWVTCGGSTVYRIVSGSSNVFLVTNGTRMILIDTSVQSKYAKIKKALKLLKCRKIDLLILTHVHFDHVENAVLLKQEYQPKIVVHTKDASYLEAGKHPIPKGTNPLTKLLVDKLGKKISSLVSYDAVNADIIVEDEIDLNSYGINAHIISTPGHTSGSMSVIVDHEIAIVGDAMFGVFKNSVYPPFANDIKSMIESWGKLYDTGCKTFLPSHGSERGAVLLKRQYVTYKRKYLKT